MGDGCNLGWFPGFGTRQDIPVDSDRGWYEYETKTTENICNAYSFSSGSPFKGPLKAAHSHFG
jgi:hypothetical protein